jgi:ribosomal protein L21E
MKGYIRNRQIVLVDELPEGLKDGDEVEISITPVSKSQYPFPTFKLGVKDEYLKREKIYESDQDLL